MAFKIGSKEYPRDGSKFALTVDDGAGALIVGWFLNEESKNLYFKALADENKVIEAPK